MIFGLFDDDRYRKQAIETATTMWPRLTWKQKTMILRVFYEGDDAVTGLVKYIADELDEKAIGAVLNKLRQTRNRYVAEDCSYLCHRLSKSQIKEIIPLLIDPTGIEPVIGPDRFVRFSHVMDEDLNNYIMDLFDSCPDNWRKSLLTLLYNLDSGTKQHIRKQLGWFMSTATTQETSIYKRLKSSYDQGLLV